MLKLLRQVLKVGEATHSYPFAPISLSPGFRGKPQHDPAACIACAACAIACPSNALSIANDTDRGVRTWAICYGRCIFCGRCEEVCPTHAIALMPEFELAVMSKQDLIARAHFGLAACRRCGTYFAPAGEIAYVLALLKQAGLPADRIQERRELLETCPECRRRLAIPPAQTVFSSQLLGVTEWLISR
jgi:hydrogenase-4 component H